MKRIAILGSTGTIGLNTLRIVDRYPDQFKVVGLTAYRNAAVLSRQIAKYKPRYVAAHNRHIVLLKKQRPSGSMRVMDVEDGAEMIAGAADVDIVIVGIQGAAALRPFLKAVRCGKTVAPANKEALVMAGQILMQEAAKHKARIIPVDSEQSAIFQCLEAAPPQTRLKKVYLTASGGSLYHVPKRRLASITKKEVLNHPRWKMGKKITVDSATLMNKGLEIIEAKWLFDLKVRDIEVVIHPQAFIHSMIEFQDGSILAQMGVTNMRLPIQYALTYPQRWPTGLAQVSFAELKQLTFEAPDLKKFPALEICRWAIRKGRTFPCVLNAANEEAVEAFLGDRIPFNRIVRIVERTLEQHRAGQGAALSDIWEADRWAREKAKALIQNIR